MGIDLHGLHFLKFARQFGPFGATVMIGRQGIHVSETELTAGLGPNHGGTTGDFAEPLLRQSFGATDVESIDYSDYERASILLDFNTPLPQELAGKFDTVIDFGTLEHVYEVTQALRNCSLLCRPGGQILHALPANNLCGHGFWQFSPELFYSLYTPANCYASPTVLLADLADPKTWFVVDKPAGGQRVTIRTHGAVYILVRTVVDGKPFQHLGVQQSDYVESWNAGGADQSDVSGQRSAHVSRRQTAWQRIVNSWRKRRGSLLGTQFLRPIKIEALIADQ